MGTSFIEHYACRACPVRAKRVTGVRICQALLSCLGSRSKSKNHDELINYTGVMFRRVIVIVMMKLSELSLNQYTQTVVRV